MSVNRSLPGVRRRVSIYRQQPEFNNHHPESTLKTSTHGGQQPKHTRGEVIMSKEEDNKVIVGRWFTNFWGKTCDLGIVDELAAPDMLLQYSLHEPRRGREDIKAFMTDFRKAF